MSRRLITSMKQPLFPSTIGTQSRFAYFLTVKAEVRKFGQSDGQTGSWCLDKAVLPQGGGGVTTKDTECTQVKRPHRWSVILLTRSSSCSNLQDGPLSVLCSQHLPDAGSTGAHAPATIIGRSTRGEDSTTEELQLGSAQSCPHTPQPHQNRPVATIVLRVRYGQGFGACFLWYRALRGCTALSKNQDPV